MERIYFVVGNIILLGLLGLATHSCSSQPSNGNLAASPSNQILNEKEENMQHPTEEKPSLIYVYDALCGWCYGFSPVMEKFYEKYREEFQFIVVSGGMITGDRIGPIGEVAGYIKWAYKDVENKTGVTFGEGFLKGILAEGTTVFTSIPPAKALIAFKLLKKDKDSDISFAGRLQKAIYYDGIEPLDAEAYADLAEEYGVNREDFLRSFDSKATEEKMKEEFAITGKLGVKGFPSIIVQVGDSLVKIGEGYMPLEALEQRIEQAQDMAK